MAMGLQTDCGSWSEFYAVQFPFVIGNQQFFFGHNISNGYWFIQEISSDGKMGDQTDCGSWSGRYESMFPFSIDGSQYIYGQSQGGLNWFIQEILSDGKMGKQTQAGQWDNFYVSSIPITLNGQQFFLGNDPYTRGICFIQQLLPGGQMGPQISQIQRFGGDINIPFTGNGMQRVWGQANFEDPQSPWRVIGIGPTGTIVNETTGTFNNYYGAQFIYQSSDGFNLFGQNLDNGYWFIQQLSYDAAQDTYSPGLEIQTGTWQGSYPAIFPFIMGGQQYFYGQSRAGNWFIQQLNP